jgi:hypothetical protein
MAFYHFSLNLMTLPVKQREWKENLPDKAVREAEEGKYRLFL